jgi:hypothetical protein
LQILTDTLVGWLPAFPSLFLGPVFFLFLAQANSALASSHGEIIEAEHRKG